jgi:hypothetical protein
LEQVCSRDWWKKSYHDYPTTDIGNRARCGASTEAETVTIRAIYHVGTWWLNVSVSSWGASSGEPRQLAQTRTSSDGRFEVGSQDTLGADVILYLVAKGGEATVNKGSGDNQAIAMLSVLGNKLPPKVIINEMTTVASVWTHEQFLDGTAIKGHFLGLKIAAGNVPNFVDLQTGGWGTTIQDPLNSGQTPTMANFATLADLLSGCVTRVKADACSKLFAAATPPTSAAPTNTVNRSLSLVQARAAVCIAR